MVAIAPDVSGLLTEVPVVDNQLVKKGQVLFVVDRPRYEQALAEASADVAYYQTLAAEKRREAGRRVKLGVQAMSQEEIDQSNNSLQTVQHQLAKAVAARELAQLDLERTTVRAPADGWITNLNVHAGGIHHPRVGGGGAGEKDSFYILAYLEETKLNGLNKGDRADHPARQQPHHARHRRQRGGGGEQQQQHGQQQGLASIDSNLVGALAQRVPVKILLDAKDQQHPYPAGTTATVVIVGKNDRNADSGSPFVRLMHRLREFG